MKPLEPINGENLDRQEETLTDKKFRTFRSETSDEIRLLKLLSNSSSCLLDPVLTWLLKKCIADVLPLVTVIMNKSVTSGKLPESFENAIVKPQELKDYRPVSNIDFL